MSQRYLAEICAGVYCAAKFQIHVLFISSIAHHKHTLEIQQLWAVWYQLQGYVNMFYYVEPIRRSLAR